MPCLSENPPLLFETEGSENVVRMRGAGLRTRVHLGDLTWNRSRSLGRLTLHSMHTPIRDDGLICETPHGNSSKYTPHCHSTAIVGNVDSSGNFS